MTILFCPDSFKGTLSAREAGEAMARGAASVLPGLESLVLPLADGGEGTLAALLAGGGERFEREVAGPSGAAVTAAWGRLPDGTGVVEMARASGLHWVSPETNDLGAATSEGTGQILLAALDAGCKRILVGIGGSATNDGGIGAMRALGARFLDADGAELRGGGADLPRIARVDLDGFADFDGVDVEVASDVDNPLCGPDGATFTFGPQKGGTPVQLEALEAGMRNYARVLRETFGWDVALAPGAGAAGGLGAALLAFLNAQFRSGIDVVMDAVGFTEAAAQADALVTGEGRLDAQTLRGKAMSGILRRAGGKPVYALCGRVDLPESEWRALGLAGAWGLLDEPETAPDALTAPSDALERLAARALSALS